VKPRRRRSLSPPPPGCVLPTLETIGQSLSYPPDYALS
jgi:hypothetical protein